MPALIRTFPQWCLLSLLAVYTALPWLSPFTWGPNPDLMQRLITAGCCACFLAFWALGPPWLSPRLLARTVAVGWLAAALLSAAMALLQYFGAADAAWADWVTPATPGTAYANLRQRNQFASLTAIGLLSLWFVAAQWPLAQATPRATALQRGLVAAALLLLAAGNAASSSRTGALQWLLIAALALLWEPRGQRTLLRWSALALGLYLAANLLLPWLLHTVSGLEPRSVLDRLNDTRHGEARTVLWANVLELIAERPWTGWGWGELKFAHFMHPYAGERFSEILDNAHNLPLHLAVSWGVPAAAGLCGGILGLALSARPWRERATTRQLAWGVCMVLAVHSLLEYPLWYAPFQMTALLALGMLVGPRVLQWRGLPFLACGVAGLLVAAMAYTGWEYWRVSQLYIAPALREEAWREDTFNKVRGSVIFRGEEQFAYVTTTPVTPETAKALYASALQVLHFSPEPKVIAVLLESAALLHLESPLTAHLRRQWRVAYPQNY